MKMKKSAGKWPDGDSRESGKRKERDKNES